MSPSSQSSPLRDPENSQTWLDSRRGAFHDLVSGVREYAIYAMDLTGTILDWNLGAERIKNYTAAEIVGKNFACFFPPESMELPASILQEAARRGSYSGEGWRLRKNGERFWAHATVTALRSDQGQVEGFMKITRDLTLRHTDMQALRQSEERFRLLVESVQDHAIFLLDPEGHITSWNAGARRIKGYEQEEIIGQHFSVFYPPQAVHSGVPSKLLQLALKAGRAEQEGWRVRKDGTRFWGKITITPLYNQEGELQGFAKITRDLSARRQVESLRAASRRKDAFLATLAHELRNPLAPILPGIDIILNSPGNQEKIAQVAGMMRRQVDQMTCLIEDLVDVSRINSGKINLRVRRVPLADVLTRALESVTPLIEKQGHEFHINDWDAALTVEVDTHRLSQIVANLLSNAAKYTPPGGRIELNISVQRGNTLKLVVADNGLGIPLDIQDSIFDLFDQGEYGSEDGLGVGLTLVRSLARMHRGDITLRSDGPGKGCEFTLLLPVVVAPPEDRVATSTAVRPAADSAARGGTSPKVLVADDGRAAADILAMFFQMEGLEVQVCYDGAEAVQAARTFTPDIVVLDLGMPRMDGFEACQRIREMHPDALIAALSGWGGKDDRRRTSQAGFDEHIVKPTAPDDLRKLIDRYSERSRGKESE